MVGNVVIEVIDLEQLIDAGFLHWTCQISIFTPLDPS